MSDYNKSILEYIRDTIINHMDCKRYNVDKIVHDLSNKGINIYRVNSINTSTIDLESEAEFLRYLKNNNVKHVFLLERQDNIEFELNSYNYSKILDILGDEALDITPNIIDNIKSVINYTIDARDFHLIDMHGVGLHVKYGDEVNRIINNIVSNYLDCD